MASRKRVKKKHIKEDQLITTAVKASQFIQRYYTQVIVGIVVLVLAVVAILFTAQTRRGNVRDSEQLFGRAMSQYNARDMETAANSFSEVIDRYGGSRAGVFARYFLGQSLLMQERHDEAMNAFEQYLDKAGTDAPFRAAATIGIAMCYEGLRDFATAAELLEQLSQTLEPEDPRYPEVLFQAATDFEKAGSRPKAVDLYREVSETATGPLKDRANAWVALLE